MKPCVKSCFFPRCLPLTDQPQTDVFVSPESRYWVPYQEENYELSVGGGGPSRQWYARDGLPLVQPRPYFSPQLDQRMYPFRRGISYDGEDYGQLQTDHPASGYAYHHSCLPTTFNPPISDDTPVSATILRSRKRRWPFRQSSDPVLTNRTVSSSFPFGCIQSPIVGYGESYTCRLPPIDEAPQPRESGRPTFYAIPPPSGPAQMDSCNSYANLTYQSLQPMHSRLPPSSTGYVSHLFQSVPPPTWTEHITLFRQTDNYMASNPTAQISYTAANQSHDCTFLTGYDSAGTVTSGPGSASHMDTTYNNSGSTFHNTRETDRTAPANLQFNWPLLADSPTQTEYEPHSVTPERINRTYKQ